MYVASATDVGAQPPVYVPDGNEMAQYPPPVYVPPGGAVPPYQDPEIQSQPGQNPPVYGARWDQSVQPQQQLHPNVYVGGDGNQSAQFNPNVYVPPGCEPGGRV